jgi:transcriptional regulator with XRE-family HTH domain
MSTVAIDTDTMELIAANVRRLRGDRSFREVAKMCSSAEWTCYPATIQQIESGQHMPNAAVIYRLAIGLGVKVNALYEKHD